jgi:hypothetical protein
MVSLSGVDQRQDVRVVEPGRDLDLGQEPLTAEYRAQLGAQHLERHLAIVLEVGGQVDGGHAAGAELALDPVAFFEGGGQTEGIAHGALENGVSGTGSPATSSPAPRSAPGSS